MLGKTASGLFWMSRYLERAEAQARLIEAGFRIALTRASAAESEWESLLATVGQRDAYTAQHGTLDAARIIAFLLSDRSNAASVISMVKVARDNARLVRTALTREVWEAINESWIALDARLKGRIRPADLPDCLAMIRRQNALVRGAMAGTQLRNDIYNFMRLGTFVERADNTARILDVKYFVLLPSVAAVGSTLDMVQWETILRSVSAQRAFHWLHGPDTTARGIAEFLILHPQMPRSLAFCHAKICDNLWHLETQYGGTTPAHALAERIGLDQLGQPIDAIFDYGLHQFIGDYLAANNALATQIAADYSFVAD
jgi:uncharacterized alpha-E superfamily protein